MVREPKTARGRVSRDKILAAAATLFHERGVHATSVDDVLAASGTGKSQFYHHFAGKSELVREVLAYQYRRLCEEQAPLLERLGSWEGIEAWFAYVVDWQRRRRLLGGCPIGSMAAEMADWDDTLRAELADAFRHWEAQLAQGFSAMRDAGELRPDADPAVLAEVTLAAIQGGTLLARTKGDVASLEGVLQGVLVYLRGFAPVPGNGARRVDATGTKGPAGAGRRRRSAAAT